MANALTPLNDDKTPWALVILLGALSAFGPMSIDMYLPSLPAISADFHAASGASQGTMAAFLIGMAVGQFFFGPASDRWGRRSMLFLGVGLFVVATVACALAPSLGMLVLARFVEALGGCAGPVIARAVVRDRFDHRQSARVMSQQMLIMGVAPLVAPLLGGVLLGFSGWRMIFWFIAAFGAVMGVWMFFVLGESRSEATRAQADGETPWAAYGALLRHRALITSAAWQRNAGSLLKHVAN